MSREAPEGFGWSVSSGTKGVWVGHPGGTGRPARWMWSGVPVAPRAAGSEGRSGRNPRWHRGQSGGSRWKGPGGARCAGLPLLGIRWHRGHRAGRPAWRWEVHGIGRPGGTWRSWVRSPGSTGKSRGSRRARGPGKSPTPPAPLWGAAQDREPLLVPGGQGWFSHHGTATGTSCTCRKSPTLGIAGGRITPHRASRNWGQAAPGQHRELAEGMCREPAPCRQTPRCPRWPGSRRSGITGQQVPAGLWAESATPGATGCSRPPAARGPGASGCHSPVHGAASGLGTGSCLRSQTRNLRIEPGRGQHGGCCGNLCPVPWGDRAGETPNSVRERVRAKALKQREHRKARGIAAARIFV